MHQNLDFLARILEPVEQIAKLLRKRPPLGRALGVTEKPILSARATEHVQEVIVVLSGEADGVHNHALGERDLPQILGKRLARLRYLALQRGWMNVREYG